MKSTAKLTVYALLKLSFLAACLLLFSSFQPFKRLWHPSDLKPYTEWFQINWQGQVVGWAQKELRIENDFYQVLESEHFEGRVRGKRLKFIYQKQLNFSTKPPFQLIEGAATLIEPNLVMETSFSNDEQLLIQQSRNDNISKFTESPLDYTLNDYLAWRQFIEGSPELGSSVSIKELDSHSLEVQQKKYHVTKLPQGRHQRYQLVDPDGALYDFNLKGHLLSERRGRGIKLVANKQKPSFNPEMQTDLYTNVGLASQKPLGQISKLESLEISVSKDNLKWLTIHPSVKVSENTLVIRKGARHKATPNESTNWHFDPVSPSLKSLDVPLTPAKSRTDKVNDLVTFVYDYLYYEPTPTSFTTDEIIRNGYGDCTEYTQLLLALLNAEKIPAREVEGYIYLGDDEQRFGGHAWVEVLIDDQWVGVDPTWNLTQVTAAHLPITIPQEKSVSDLDFVVEQIHYQ